MHRAEMRALSSRRARHNMCPAIFFSNLNAYDWADTTTKFAEIDDNVSELIVCNFVHLIHSAAQVYYWPNCSVHWATGKLTN